MRAYDEIYLDDAMQNLGELVDYTVNRCGEDPDQVMRDFINSGMAEKFGHGVPAVVSGRSGIELAYEMFQLVNRQLREHAAADSPDYGLSREYWGGWSLALLEWHSGYSFREIMDVLPLSELIRMYPALHESPEEKTIEVLERRMREASAISKLQKQRKRAGLTQKQLAERSGLNLRTLQQYEIRGKDINMAAASSVAALARVLGCEVEDIMD